ncbi:MAG: dihydropteroate synthase [Chloroflexota bacterium]|nr:dihydropteroate synthase [Chloroflexota bacterium]
MIAIGESIHVLSNQVKEAIANRDSAFIQSLARNQVERGARVLDLNIGPQRKEGVAIMSWMVETVQEVVDVPLSLDTTNLAAIEAGLKRVKKQAIVNSASAQEERLRDVPPLAAKYRAKLIALAMGGHIPATAEDRVAIALEKLIPRAEELGMPMEDLLLDPLVLTVAGMQDQAVQAVETVRFLKQAAVPAPMTVVGLSNISNQVPAEGRSLITCTFAVMLMAAGLDYAIADPMDERLWEFIHIIEGRDASTGKGKLLLALYDATANMGELDPSIVDMKDPDQVAIWKTVQILKNQVIYADSYLRV